MYAHHFGLIQDPFSIAPDPRYLFMSERHREALAHLLYGVAGPHGASSGTGGGFVLLTGDIGTGKTTICRCFMEQIPPGCHVAYIFNPKLTVTELLQSVCEEFHITTAASASSPPTVKDYIDALNSFLLKSHAAGQSSVLIIDEAQNLSADVLEQLRLLTNLETSERKLLQIVLIGQPELRALLASPTMEQLAQRVIARFHLDALTEAESAQYIEHRLAVAGFAGPSPFDRPVLKRIHRLTRGVPRRINLLCGRALLGAWANGLFRVNREVVNKAAAEVFGAETGYAPGSPPRSAIYALWGLILLAGAALAGFLVSDPTQKPPAPSRPLASSVPAPQAGASLPAPAKTPVFAPTLVPAEDIDALLAQLPADVNAAWRVLAPAWKLPATDADPCLAASAQQLLCYRTDSMTVPLLRQLGRPGILTLHTGNGPPLHAVLVGLGEQTATLQGPAGQHTLKLISLGRLWRGEFATYWRPPTGYTPGLQGGSAGPVIRQLASQLAQLEGTPAPSVSTTTAPPMLDAALRSRVRAFQRAQGIDADGQPGPLTFMQIDSATNADVPRLQINPTSVR